MANCAQQGCRTPRPGELHCGLCHVTVGTLALFDAHQDVDYSRPRGRQVVCRDPAAMRVTDTGKLAPAGRQDALRLVQGPGGTWHTPQGLQSRIAHSRALHRGQHA
jgi:hypothetical protein